MSFNKKEMPSDYWHEWYWVLRPIRDWPGDPK
jgi:hypothetical protein